MEPNQQKPKKYITRDTEIKKKWTITRTGKGEGDNRKEGEGLSRNMYKGPMDKVKGGRVAGGSWGSLGCGNVGEKMEAIVLEQQ